MTATTNFLIGFCVIGLHEAAHVAAARSLGIAVKRMGVSWKGPYIVREAGSPRANMITTLAGPMLNIALALTWPLSHEFALANLIFGFSNLIPMAGSDGQRAWALLEKEFREPAV